MDVMVCEGLPYGGARPRVAGLSRSTEPTDVEPTIPTQPFAEGPNGDAVRLTDNARCQSNSGGAATTSLEADGRTQVVHA